jgi:hypothetical protein
MIFTHMDCSGTIALTGLIFMLAFAPNAGATSRASHQRTCGTPPESAIADFAESAAEYGGEAQSIKNAFRKPNEDVRGLFDERCWGIVSSTETQIGSSTPTKILFLESVYPTIRDGFGRPRYAANLLLAEGRRVVYQFFPTVPGWNSTKGKVLHYMIHEGVDIRDVTGDGIPEILFYTEDPGISESAIDVHVVRLNPRTHRFSEAFTFHISSWWERLRWMAQAGHVYAIVAEGVDPAAGDHDAPGACHSCPKPVTITAYEWDNGKNSFVVKTHEVTSQTFGDPLDALKEYQLPTTL